MKNRTTFLLCTLLATGLLTTPTTHAQLAGPTAPTALSAWPSAPGEISLSWEPASSLLGITAYRVYRVASDGNLTHVIDVPADHLSATEAGLEPGATFTYAVSALDALGEGPTSEHASATTWAAPSAPVGVATASGPGPVGEATVSWSAPVSDGGVAIAAYHVYRDGVLAATLGADVLTWTDTGLSPLHASTYSVSASNAVGEGPQSDGACGMPSPWTPELGCGSLL